MSVETRIAKSLIHGLHDEAGVEADERTQRSPERVAAVAREEERAEAAGEHKRVERQHDGRVAQVRSKRLNAGDRPERQMSAVPDHKSKRRPARIETREARRRELSIAL